MLALAALFGALALFWLSTRQFSLLWRGAIWILAAGLLMWAAIASDNAEFGLREALGNAWVHIGNIRESALAQALTRNAPSVTRFLPQLTDFFVVAGVVLGLLSALAFTKGERLERILRPTILAAMGFVAGSVATLAIVAIGLGGQVKPRTYIGYISQTTLNGEASIHDGDTFWLGEVSLRLWGADAPELNQVCRDQKECGDVSRAQLEEFLVGALVQCDQKQSIRSGTPTESFGRPLVQCWRIGGHERVDVAEWMIRRGFAVQYEGNDAYGYSTAEAEAHNAAAGLQHDCSLRPDIWRSRRPEHRLARAAFERDATTTPGVATMGACDRPGDNQ